jgi:regulator of cell morphogenesis and NO signaling
MFLKPFEINRKSFVSDIVAQDYRTATIFRKYGIGYCCGGKWPMEIACEMQGVDADKLIAELGTATRTIQVPTLLDFAEWDTDFLLNYLVNVHHLYLKKSLPETQHLLNDFTKEHSRKYPFLAELEQQFDLLLQQLLTSMQQEEEVIFPYIRQVANAHKHRESYAALLVRTLRKPMEETIFKGHEVVNHLILSIRNLTGKYTAPQNACISHKVVMAKLRELDNDLMQHVYLEQSILFPRALAIEKEVLSR